MKLGLLGGSFNPPHNGHLGMARAAKEAHSLDEVWLIVAARPPHKQDDELVDFGQRLEMTQLATRELPYLKASDIEASLQGTSYTWRTLEVIAGQNPDIELYFIMGADTVPELSTWKKPDRIFQLAAPVVIPRSGFSPQDVDRLGDTLPGSQLGVLRKAYLQVEPVDISSTTIRECAREGKPFEHQVLSSVAEYIKRNGLYR